MNEEINPQKIVEFMAKLVAAGMGEESIATRGYDFALTWLLSDAERSIRKGEEVSGELKLKLMERAANLMIQATALLEAGRRSLADMKRMAEQRRAGDGYPLSAACDLGHNANVYFYATKYIDIDGGKVFYHDEISIDNKTHHVLLIPGEALSLLEWLHNNRERLEKMAAEGQPYDQ